MSWKFCLALVVMVLTTTGTALEDSQTNLAVTQEDKESNSDFSPSNTDGKDETGIVIPANAPLSQREEGKPTGKVTQDEAKSSSIGSDAVTIPEPVVAVAPELNNVTDTVETEKSTESPTEHTHPINTELSSTKLPSTTEQKAETTSEATTLMTTSEAPTTTSTPAQPTTEKTTPSSALPTTVAPVKV